ncbi:type VI secretion system membrane subunit TssM [Jannaschia sp. CCS1]|uniref:type VI secretion system membrane subunit TssM n=1 Tax=Jannaschia sp. (strain CCS1) TaxID=290400 RepID=UPI000053C5B1|nr:type VI secretion system membrane subunit TssM [Jannaschia sp. CCS1]ABD55952.1 ImcF-related protein [Jannaschia sp. CCS1]
MNPLGMWTTIRSNVQSYASVLGPRFAALIWVGAICAVIWIFGPRLPWGDTRPLEPARIRLILIAVILGLWLIYALISWLRGRKRAASEDAAITESPEAVAAGEAREEIAELRSRLRDALKMMRKHARRRFGYAYDFPWYLMMGAPGAGKTTLLQRSGLKFPLGDALRAEPVQGVGGTRNCNWWFTDRAILIDTAGRYTTQETGQARDREGFLGFLSMLRRTRRQQPINGIVLTLSLTDLLAQDPEDRLRDIRAIRQRLTETEEALGARIPVYMVLTKADRLTGFSRFFDSLGQQARKQVWGITFPYEEAQTKGTLPDIFSREYQGLLARLNAMLIERFQQETDIDQRGRIFRFPAQVSALHDALREIVEELSSGAANVSEPLLRGIYFASATQENAGPVAAIPGVPQTAAAMNRTYFVERLFREVILGEAALVGRDARVSRRRRIATGLAYGAAASLALFLLGSWTLGFSTNRQALAAIDTGLVNYEDLADTIPVRDVADADFLRVLPALDRLARTPDAFHVAEGPGLTMRRASFGMDRSARIESGHAEAYSEALGAFLLPRYMVALQNVLQDGETDEATAFETLKHYLSLAGLGPIDRDGLLAQSERLFDQLYPGSGRGPTRDALQAHMVAMLDRGTLPVLEIDEMLVEDTRARIAERSPAQRVLDLLADRPAARAIPDWTLTSAAGPRARQVFVGDGTVIDGLYTRAGYREVLLPRIGALSEVAVHEDWVRGPGTPTRATPSDIAADAVTLYYAAFESHWRAALSGLSIVPTEALSGAADLALTLASEADPLSRLARDIAARTDLITPSPIDDFDASALPFDPATAPDPYGPLRRSLEPEEDAEGNTTDALTPLVPLYDEIYQQLTRLDSPDPAAAAALASETALRDAAQSLVAEGRQLDAPIDAFVVTIAARVSEAAVGQARAAADALWQAEGYPMCDRAISDRYPFSPAASADVTLTDFTAVFGPNGLFATFFAEHLADLVNTTADPWVWSGGLAPDGDIQTALHQFQRAAQIRAAFFPNGVAEPRVELRVDLIALEQGARVALFEIGDRRSAHREDLSDEERLIWPPEDSDIARVMLLPGDRETAPTERGPWAPFRLIDRAEVTPGTDNEFQARFTVDGRAVTFNLTSGSVNNPFNLPALTAFRCPQSLAAQ